jgi:CBS domain-containing protein
MNTRMAAGELAPMRRRGVRRLPLVDAAGRLVGVLGLDDFRKVVVEQRQSFVQARRSRRRREAAARP